MSKELDSITGRDGYIMAQALYMACKYQQMLKDNGDTSYEWSNHQDMKSILNRMYGGVVGVFVAQDRYRGVEPANLNDEKREKEDVE